MTKRLLALAALVLSCLVVAPAAAAIRPATCATLMGVLNAVQPGDVVRVAAGDCGLVTGAGSAKRFQIASPGVVVEPDGSGPVSLKGLTLNLWEGWTFRGFEIRGPVLINQGARVRVVGNRVVGQEPDWTVAKAVGVRITAGTDHEVSDNLITGWGQGLTASGINAAYPLKGAVIARNTLERIAFDGIRGFGDTQGVTVFRNYLRDFAPVPGAHKDAIQTFGANIVGLRIIGNVFDAGSTGATRQFQFLDNLTSAYVLDNTAFGASSYGIASRDRSATQKTGVREGVFAGNWVQGYGQWGPPAVSVNDLPAVIVGQNFTPPRAKGPSDRAAFEERLRQTGWLPPLSPEQRAVAMEAELATLRAARP